ncbi:MAG TPA: hypothetical protein VGL02_07290 [Streptomyces sp.]
MGDPVRQPRGRPQPAGSVGLTFDERVFPKQDGVSAQDEFDAFMERFPEIAEQFKGATAVRPWVSTGRLQYSATQTVGDRYCLTAHAAGFIDALYSRGLTNTLEVVNALAWRLIEASKDGDWSKERFAYVNDLQQGLFDIHDDLVYCSFVAFRDYDLWNAVVRVWESTSIMPTVTIDRAYRTFMANRDEQVFRDLEKRDAPGLPAPVGQDIAALLAFTRGVCQQVEAGTLDAKDASAQLFARLQRSEFLPAPFELGSPDNKCFEATPALIQSAVAWAAEDAPAHIAQLFAR